jgi:hypothetical protein
MQSSTFASEHRTQNNRIADRIDFCINSQEQHKLFLRQSLRFSPQSLFLIFTTMKVLRLLFIASSATSAIAGSPSRLSQVVQSKATTTARNRSKQAISSTQNVAVDNPLLDIRGGACSDSSPALLFKFGTTSAVLETATMVGLLVACPPGLIVYGALCWIAIVLAFFYLCWLDTTLER